jgi:nucleolar pre-ribosomal-associated protein 2
MIILAATDAASAVSEPCGLTELKSSSMRKLEKHTREAMQSGDIRAWKIHIFLRKYLSDAVEVPQPSSFDDLKKVPHGLREALLRELVESATENMDATSKLGYLRELVHGFKNGCDTDGQLLAIEHVAGQLISTFALDHSTRRTSILML